MEQGGDVPVASMSAAVLVAMFRLSMADVFAGLAGRMDATDNRISNLENIQDEDRNLANDRFATMANEIKRLQAQVSSSPPSTAFRPAPSGTRPPTTSLAGPSAGRWTPCDNIQVHGQDIKVGVEQSAGRKNNCTIFQEALRHAETEDDLRESIVECGRSLKLYSHNSWDILGEPSSSGWRGIRQGFVKTKLPAPRFP